MALNLEVAFSTLYPTATASLNTLNDSNTANNTKNGQQDTAIANTQSAVDGHTTKLSDHDKIMLVFAVFVQNCTNTRTLQGLIDYGHAQGLY